MILLAALFALATPAPTAAAAPAAPLTEAPWLPAYDHVRAALVADDDAGSVAAARTIPPMNDAAVDAAVAALVAAPDLAARRQAFAELSRALVLRLDAGSLGGKVLVYYCPMAPGYRYWLQPKAGIANPYMGTSMPACGSQVTLKAAVKDARAQ